MAVATFDTLKFANTLKGAGVPPLQTEAQAVAFAEIIQLNLKDLATKEDLGLTAKAAKADLDAAVRELRGEIKEEVSKLRLEFSDMRGQFNQLKWMTGAVITLCVGILVRLFLKP